MSDIPNGSAETASTLTPNKERVALPVDLRDYFAGQALPSLIEFYQRYLSSGPQPIVAAANVAYAYADAMIAEREK